MKLDFVHGPDDCPVGLSRLRAKVSTRTFVRSDDMDACRDRSPRRVAKQSMPRFTAFESRFRNVVGVKCHGAELTEWRGVIPEFTDKMTKWTTWWLPFGPRVFVESYYFNYSQCKSITF